MKPRLGGREMEHEVEEEEHEEDEEDEEDEVRWWCDRQTCE